MSSDWGYNVCATVGFSSGLYAGYTTDPHPFGALGDALFYGLVFLIGLTVLDLAATGAREVLYDRG